MLRPFLFLQTASSAPSISEVMELKDIVYQMARYRILAIIWPQQVTGTYWKPAVTIFEMFHEAQLHSPQPHHTTTFPPIPNRSTTLRTDLSLLQRILPILILCPGVGEHRYVYS